MTYRQEPLFIVIQERDENSRTLIRILQLAPTLRCRCRIQGKGLAVEYKIFSSRLHFRLVRLRISSSIQCEV